MNKFIRTFKHNKFYWLGHLETANLYAEERKSSWLELFVDLVFVSALGLLVHGLVDNLSLIGLVLTLIYFTLVWSSWNSITLYSHLFENRGIYHRFIMFINLVSSAFILLAYTSDYGIYFDNVTLNLSFVFTVLISRLMIAFTWHIAQQHTHNKHLRIYLLERRKVYIVSVALIICALPLIYVNLIFTPQIMAIVSINEVFSHVFYKKYKITAPMQKFFHLEHLSERFGLFSMLIIGESIIAITQNMQTSQINPSQIILLIMLLLFIFLVWWLYYEIIMNKEIRNLSQWKVAHLCLHFSLFLIAAATVVYFHGHVHRNIIFLVLSIYFLSLIFLKSTIITERYIESDAYHLDDRLVNQKVNRSHLISIVLFMILYFVQFHNPLVLIISINLILVFNIITYYYYYIRLMNNIMW